MPNDNEIKFDTWLKRINAISSIATAFLALIISVLTLSIYRNTYNITEEQFLLNSTENLALSVGSGNIDIVDLKPGEVEHELYYKVELSICIVNKSNLPISIVSESISRSDYGNAVRLSATIYELDLPISMQPQETKFLDCYMLIEIPDFVNKFIVEKFPEPSAVDFDTITKYLYFEKYTDLIGNEVIVEDRDGATYFTQHLTLPLSLRLGTSKGNDFTTQFYEGGPLFFLDKKYMDELSEQYGSWGIEFSKEPIVDDSNKNYMSFWEFIKRDPSVLLMLILPETAFAFAIAIAWIGYWHFLKMQREKRNHDNSNITQEDSYAEQENLPVKHETSPAEQETSPAEQETPPAERETLPAEQETPPTERETLPTEQETSSAGQEDSLT